MLTNTSNFHDLYRISSNELPTRVLADFQQQVFPEEIGDGKSNFFQIEPELSFIETVITPCKNFAVTNHSIFHEPRMVVTLGLRGSSKFVEDKSEIVFKEGYTSISMVHSNKGERHYLTDNTVSQLRFSFTRAWLEKHIGSEKANTLFNLKRTELITCKPIHPISQISAHQLSNYSPRQETKKMFLLGSSLTILSAELEQLFSENSKSREYFNHKDQLMANRARDILLTEFRTPPSVEELAQRVGTNTFKLKKLFHHFFNSTPYGMVLDFRMRKAHQLLLTSNFKILDVAEEVGYQHPGNFTATFTKYFGVTPKSVSRGSLE